MDHQDQAIDLGLLQAGDLEGLSTPSYVYDFDVLTRRIGHLKKTFDGLFVPSYAVKSNPNLALLAHIAASVPFIDASSAHEVERALSVGVAPEAITWSGPGKRESELRAIAGRGVNIVLEAEDEIDVLAGIAAGLSLAQPVLLRINPDHVPKGFGASMSGKPSQFGIDEAAMPQALARIRNAPSLQLIGFHSYTGSMCLTASAIAENLTNLCRIFAQASELADIIPQKLIFGAGFGVPYHAGQASLDITEVRDLSMAAIAALDDHPRLSKATRLLELGRWITAPGGALITRVLSTKESRGKAIAVCDAGFNNHLAAAGMMGSVFQKNYPFEVLNRSDPGQDLQPYLLAGPLCTSIDLLARNIEMPPLSRGDMLAVMMSGAYGLTASPTRFISHPEPVEYALQDGALRDISESRLNVLGGLVSGLAT